MCKIFNMVGTAESEERELEAQATIVQMAHWRHCMQANSGEERQSMWRRGVILHKRAKEIYGKSEQRVGTKSNDRTI